MQVAARPKIIAGMALAASSVIVGIPTASSPGVHSTSAAVRLASTGLDTSGLDTSGLDTSGAASLDTSGAALVSDFTNGLTSPDNFAHFLLNFGTDLSTFLETGVNTATSGLNLGGITSDLSSTLTTDLGTMTGASSVSGIQNIPYNVLADLLNTGNSEALALQEYDSALGPAHNALGVPGWIPPGATLENGGVVLNSAGQEVYAIGGTDSYYFESVGNTFGWDDGNWPQLDGLASFLAPYPALAQPIISDIQLIAQAEIVDGARVDCEFECANAGAYLGSWFHVPLSELLHGYTYPTVLADSVGGTSATGVINSGGVPGENVIWSGQTVTLDPSAIFNSVAANLEASPSADPIVIPNPVNVADHFIHLVYGDFNTDFSPFEQGSIAYWGAPTDYTIPSLLGGLVQNLTGIPNQFTLANHGAEPLSGYTEGPSSLPSGLEQGFQYLVHGLEGYLSPATYLAAGAGANTSTSAAAASTDSSTLSSDLSTMLGSGTLSSDLSALTDPSTLATDLSTQLSTDFGVNLASLIP